jgi:hypothetical protein
MMTRATTQQGLISLATLLVVIVPFCADRASASEPPVVVKTISEDALPGRLLDLSLEGGLRLQLTDGTEKNIPAEELVRISVPGDKPLAQPRGIKVTTVGGDVLYGRLRGEDQDTFRLNNLVLGAIDIPLEIVASFEADRMAQPRSDRRLAFLRQPSPPSEDRLLLTNGDALSGFITAVKGDRILFESSLGEQEISIDLILLARLANQPGKAPGEKRAVVHLRHGGRLTTSSVSWRQDEIEARWLRGKVVHFDLEEVSMIEFLGGRWEWLTSHEPVEAQHTPMFSLDWPYRRDVNVLGNPLRIAGERFNRGIGVHSRSLLAFELRGRYREFVTAFGLDDESGLLADVDVSIRVDGQTRFEQKSVKASGLNGPIRLNVTDASRLDLLVDFGQNGDIQDRFDWIEPGLIR